jgi:hypothetical protein
MVHRGDNRLQRSLHRDKISRDWSRPNRGVTPGRISYRVSFPIGNPDPIAYWVPRRGCNIVCPPGRYVDRTRQRMDKHSSFIVIADTS